MIRAHSLVHEPSGQIVCAKLAYDCRHRRRLAVETTAGEKVLLDLPEATRLRDGDLIALEDGRTLRIEAEAEPVADITPGDGATLAQLAWHLGNRHTPTAIFPGVLRIHRDHVLEAMVERFGATVAHVMAPFDPEVGAYHDGGGHHHHHD